MASLLIIDDNTSVLRSLEYFFGSDGHSLMLAESGESGLRLAAERLPDIILLDIQMQPMSGFAVCKALKADGTLRHIPVVMMTGCPTRDVIARGVSEGALVVVGKPFDLDRLKVIVDEALAAGGPVSRTSGL